MRLNIPYRSIKNIWRYRKKDASFRKQVIDVLMRWGIFCLFQHKWEYWLLLDSWKCERCGDPRAWHDPVYAQERPEDEAYFRNKRYMKRGDTAWKDAIRMRRSIGGGRVGYFNDKGERVA